MRASHDLFDYGFSEDSPMRLPAVSVEVAAGVYSSNQTFQSPEAATLGDSVSKVGSELSARQVSVNICCSVGGYGYAIAQRLPSVCARVTQPPRLHVTNLQGLDPCRTALGM